MRFFCSIFFFCLSTSLVCSCSILEKQENPEVELTSKAIEKPLPPEKTGELMEKVGGNWFYGQGLGETALTVGTIFAFPPYAIYVVGNGALQVAGYKPLHVSDALPGEARDGWNSVYDSVTSAPGHVTAAVSGREYREKDVIDEDYREFLSDQYPAENKDRGPGEPALASSAVLSGAENTSPSEGDTSLR